MFDSRFVAFFLKPIFEISENNTKCVVYDGMQFLAMQKQSSRN